jgi:hypothetical protein
MKNVKGYFSINGILKIFNFFITCLLISAFFSVGIKNNPYVDNITLILGLLLALQTHIALKLEKKNSDPFILLIGYLIIFFYELRIFTLVHFPVQDVFLRFDYHPSDTNYALFYILIANLSIFLGLRCVRLGSDYAISRLDYLPSKANLKVGFTMFVLSILFSLFIQVNLPESFANFINVIYNNFLTPNMILIVIAIYVISFHENLPASYKNLLVVGALVVFVLQTLSYSRSGLLTLIDNILIIILALTPKLRIRKAFVYFGFLFLPIFMFLSLLLYSITTLSRQTKGVEGRTITEKVTLITDSRSEIAESQLFELYLGQAFSRAGYFDYTAELIAHKDRYDDIFTFQNYFKSIVDNILTPGFDLFDQPMLSNSLKYAEGNLGSFSKKQEAIDTYHTDHFGIFGEFYNLFGYFSLVILFFLSFYFKKLFLYKGNFNLLELGLKNFILLYIFYRFFNSFGIDWILMNLVIFTVSFFLLSRIIQVRASNIRNEI